MEKYKAPFWNSTLIKGTDAQNSLLWRELPVVEHKLMNLGGAAT